MHQQQLPHPEERPQERPAPRWIRIYDNGGKTFDRYTVVFTGRYRHRTDGEHWYLGMSEHPFHPQGFGQHGWSETQIDYPRYSHIGKRISWEQLPPDCQRCVRQTYDDLWPPRNRR
jgi:hypothetical protein